MACSGRATLADELHFVGHGITRKTRRGTVETRVEKECQKESQMKTSLIIAGLIGVMLSSCSPHARQLQKVRSQLIGVWSGTEDPCLGRVVSFDAKGRITEDGVAMGGGIIGSDGPRQGKVKYRLETDKTGVGTVIIRIGATGEEDALFIVEEVGDATAKMRAINPVTKLPTEVVLWKRISNEPYRIASEKRLDKGGE